MSQHSEEEEKEAEEPTTDTQTSDDSFFDNPDWEQEDSDDENSDEDSLPDSLYSDLEKDSYMRIIQPKERLIGYSFLYKETRRTPFEHLLIHRLSPVTFYRFPTEKLEYYLEYYSFEWSYYYAPDAPRVRILQIEHIYRDNNPEPEYLVIDKTFWLRLVQRTWKRKYTEKRRLERARGSVQNQRHFELRGRYLPGYNNLSVFPLF